MYKTIFYKEILENFTSRRFFAVLVLCLIIIPLGTYVASRDYQSRLHNYLESVRIYDNDHKTIWDIPSKGGAKGLRPPSPFGFLSLGLEIVMPNVAETSGNSRSTPVDIGFNNNQGLDNVYQFFFGPLDLVFIVSVVMTFFAIIFTYGAISGEKEHGTLGQILSNSVPRNQVIMAKMGANFLALAIPFLISLLIGLLLFQIGGFSLLSGNNIWPYVGLAILFSLLLVGAFFNLGLMISTRTKQGVTAIVILLLCWAFLYGLFPRLSVILSQLIYPIKSNQLAILEKDQIRLGNEKEFEAQVNKLIDSGENSEENQQAIREKYHARLVASLQELDRDMEKKQAAQMMIAINISRLSPVSCFIRPMTEIGQTGWVQYENFKSEVGRFERALNEQVYSKFKIFNDKGGRGYTNFTGDIAAPAPRLQYNRILFGTVMKNTLPDLILLIIYNLIFFAAAFVGFLKYDPR